MKRYMLLHVGFEQPTPEIMAAWGRWFESVAGPAAEHGGLRGGREITRSGPADLAMDGQAFTGYSIIRAESLEEAERIAGENPFVTAIRVYEIAEHPG